MKASLRKFAKIKKRKFAKRLVGLGCLGWSLKFGDINPNPDHSLLSLINSRQETEFLLETDNQNIENNCARIKTGSGTVIEIKTSIHSSKALGTCGGDLGKSKSGPGAKAKSDARRNFKAKSSGSIIIRGVNGFVPQNAYCQYHKSNPPVSCKPRVKVPNSPFPSDGGNNPSPPENDQFDSSSYKGGPSPFESYEYKNPEVVAQNIGFTQPKRLNKSYDKHAKNCFGIMTNRNKENLEIFKSDIQNLAQSCDEVYKGSYRYKDPAYTFLKEIDGKMTAVIVNATDGEYITSINPTNGQIENLESTGNIGLDTRPSMQLTLRLRGPKNNNL